MKDDIRKELEGLSPLLAKIKQQPENLRVPENYFQEMRAKIWEQVRPAAQEDVQSELAGLSPALAKLKQQPERLEVPENYFEQLRANIWEQVQPATQEDVQSELAGLSPALAKLKQQPENLEVPKNYFEQMRANIWEQVKPAPAVQPHAAPQESWLDGMIRQIGALMQPRMAMGFATVALLLLAGFFLLRPTTTVDDQLAQNPQVQAPADDFLADLDEMTLADLLAVDLDMEESGEAFFKAGEVDELLEEMQKENIDLESLEIYL